MSARPLKPFLTRWLHSPRWLSVLALVPVAGLCAVAVYMLWQIRVDTSRQAEITARGLVQVLGRDVARNIEVYDLSLQAVVSGLAMPELRRADPDIKRLILFDHAATALDFGPILVFDAAGKLTMNSRTTDVAPINVAEREYFQYFKAHNDTGLHVGTPIIAKLSLRYGITLSRRLNNPDGSFAGVVAGTIYLDYFHRLFAAVGADQPGIVTLYGPKGSIIMREPYEPEMIGKTVSGTASYLTMMNRRNGSFVGPAMVGTGERNYEVATVGDLPLQISIAVPADDIYAAWYWQAISLSVVVLVLGSTTVSLIWLFKRELLQRRIAQQATATLNVELQKLATTDSLTELRNRRSFDTALGQEWRRAARMQSSLSLLMLDADCFKRFNDLYGHQEGDEALRCIARAIKEATRQPQASAFRVGGEEFAVLLPHTDARQAVTIAETIRQTLIAENLRHEGNTHRRLTVSIGVASTPLPAESDESALVFAADGALYEAKRDGRNRVAVATRAGQPRELALL